MYKAIGKTYEAREWLKAVGFAWDRDAKEWTAPAYDADEWAKYSSPTYSRTSAKACQAVEIVQA